MASWWQSKRDGVHLAALDYGGEGQPVLLLHGLAGHAGEWADTAEWLGDRRVVALEGRGHGRSERRPTDVSPPAQVRDVEFAIEQLELGAVTLVGQSLGGQTALLTAAARPDIVSALVLADASPAEGDRATVAEVEAALASWPVPFATRAAAVQFFGGPSLRAEAWAGGLDQRDDGFWPGFDVGVMARTLREASQRPYWAEWAAISCPTLAVRAENGTIPAADAERMRTLHPQAEIVDLAGAEHDLHLDRPAEWRRILVRFLDSL